MPQNLLNHRQHDFMVFLAEGLSWPEATEGVGWSEVTVNGQLYALLKLHGVKPVGNFKRNMELLVEEAKRRGYDSQVYLLEYDEEGPQVAIDELGAVPDRHVPILT